MRKVINKQVTEEDLIRTVTTAYAGGWRQVKLYFMCGLPTETDDDVLQIAELAREVIKAGREAAGTKDIRCTVSIGGFVPKPHTPFQWAAQLDHETTDARLHKLRDAIRADKQYGKAIGLRYHDGKPGIVEGLLSRGDRRVGAVILQAWRDGQRFDGWSEHFSYDRWMTAAEAALADQPVDVDWFTIRERQRTEVLPWDHLDSGLDAEWLWEDWQDALAEVAVDDCRWTPCFDCGVCDQMDTEIQVGPTGVVRPAHARAAGAQPGARRRGRLSRGPETTRSRRRAHGPAAAAALRQARPAEVLQPPGLPAGARARAAPGRDPDGLQRRLLAAPQGLLRQLGAHGGGQRGRVRGDRGCAGLRPGCGAGRPRRRPAARASTWSRWSRPARPTSRTGSRRASGGSSCPASGTSRPRLRWRSCSRRTRSSSSGS